MITVFTSDTPVKKVLVYSNTRSAPKNIIDFCKTYMIYEAVRIRDANYPLFTDGTNSITITTGYIRWT